MKLFLSPHCDDETLFGAFTIMRERPHVLVVYDSVVQQQRGLPITNEERRNETRDAMEHLGYPEILWGGLGDESRDIYSAAQAIKEATSQYDSITDVWAPAIRVGGHHHHNIVGTIASAMWPEKVTFYLTYTTEGKDRAGKEVGCMPEWIMKKHRALACYKSQVLGGTGCQAHFLEDLKEYYLDAR